MDKQEIQLMIDSLKLQERVEYTSIPNLDLYMDQVITLFEDRLKHTKRCESDKLITKTMINNYIKNKLLMPAYKKKYTKEHIVLMVLLYELKQILTINDIKDLFGTIIKQGIVDKTVLADVYEIYIGTKTDSALLFAKEAEDINDYVVEQMNQLEDIEPEQIEEISDMMTVILLTQKAEYYKRLAEKIIDEKLKK